MIEFQSKTKTLNSLLLLTNSLPAILVIIFSNFFVFYDKSNTPQVKRNFISSITNLVYELPQKLPNNLKLRIQKIRKYKKDLKIGPEHRVLPISLLETKFWQIAIKNAVTFSISVELHQIFFFLKYFVCDSLSKHLFWS